MTVGERIKTLRIERDLSQEDVAKALGITKQAVYKYESGIVTNIPLSNVEQLAKLFGCTPGYLMGWTEDPNVMASNIHPITRKSFPVLGDIACGEPKYAAEEFDTFFEASSDINADFCLIAKGDSMIDARIHDGDVVFIRRQEIVDNGQIAAVIVGDEATLKYWDYDPAKQRLVLTPANRAYRVQIYEGAELDTIRCLGRAVYFMSNL